MERVREKMEVSCSFADISHMGVSSTIEDWTYTMRRTMQEIIPGLFLGPYAAAGKSKLEELQRAGITHIACVRQENEKSFIRPNFPEEFHYLVVTLADNFKESIIPKVREVKTFIDECLHHGGKVLVHCNDGMSRAPSLVIGYIMQTCGLTYRAALIYVQDRRFCVQPSLGFESQLIEFEPIYKAQVLTNPHNGGPKRKRDRDDESDTEERARTLLAAIHNSSQDQQAVRALLQSEDLSMEEN